MLSYIGALDQRKALGHQSMVVLRRLSFLSPDISPHKDIIPSSNKLFPLYILFYITINSWATATADSTTRRNMLCHICDSHDTDCKARIPILMVVSDGITISVQVQAIELASYIAHFWAVNWLISR
jgi:hypothetical protein